MTRMDDQDTSQVPAPESDSERVDRSVPQEGTASGAQREDDRNEELPESPVPDPEETDASAEDVPGAD